VTKRVEFLFDVVSPTVYLAFRRLQDIAARTNAEIVWTPIFLGGVMKATGNSPPGTVPVKGRYMDRDMERVATRFGIPFTLNEHFPVNTLPLQRAMVAVQDEQGNATMVRLAEVCLSAIWADGLNMGDPAVMSEVLAAAGFDFTTLSERAGDADIKDRLKADTDDAVKRGVFGAPSFFVDNELYFGQDRLDYVERALTG
jgi:2-hydroxychromene-2-carboxylate isomerase